MESKDLQDFIEILPADVFESLKILSLSTLLNNEIAASVLYRLQVDNPFEIIRDIKSIPIWHDRTNATWVIDDEVQDYFFAITGKKERQKLLQIILREMDVYCSYFKGTIWVDEKDYYCQMLRAGLKIDRERLTAIEKISQLISFASRNNNAELIRICYLYLEEAGIVFNERRKLKCL